MRNLAKLGLLVLTIMICLGHVRAQEIPPGSYQQTCVNIQMRSWNLFATCQDTDGRWRSSVLSDVRSCVGDVANINGQLRCNRGESWRGGDSLPEGSYRQTCRNIKVRGDAINARCEAVSGAWVRTMLDDFRSCVGDIVNDDGQLACSRAAWQANGPYMQTCTHIYVRGDDLRAACQTRDGRWNWTSLDRYQDCRAPIVNFDGQLRCGGDYDRDRDRDQYRDNDRDRRLPPGSYVQTCRNIEIQGDRLHAQCQERDGDWRWSDLDDFRRCTQGIVNFDGRLVCGQ